MIGMEREASSRRVKMKRMTVVSATVVRQAVATVNASRNEKNLGSGELILNH
jgi:hypothetical protein